MTPLLVMLPAAPLSAAAVAAAAVAAAASPVARLADAAAILAQVDPEGGAAMTAERRDGSQAIRQPSRAAFAAGLKPGPGRVEERVADLLVRLDGKAHRCVDHSAMMRTLGTRKVRNVTWSRRMAGCAG